MAMDSFTGSVRFAVNKVRHPNMARRAGPTQMRRCSKTRFGHGPRRTYAQGFAINSGDWTADIPAWKKQYHGIFKNPCARRDAPQGLNEC
jgi:hypothetical protein